MMHINKNHLMQLTGIYIILSVAGLCCYNFQTLWGPIRKRAFDCSDESLKKPYLEDTITSTNLYIIGVYVPIVVIVLCELIQNYIERKPGNESQTWLEKFICKVTIILTTFLLGLAVERLVKNVAKYKMGRLRPHFLTVCEPIDMYGYDCNGMSAPYTTEYECSSKIFSSDIIQGVSVSFPSGHSSLSFYGMVFLAAYLQRYYTNHRLIKLSLVIFLPLIQISCIFLSCFVAMSRVLDYKHHWSDVIGGVAWGSSVALVLSFYMNNQRDNIEDLAENISGSAAQVYSSKFLVANKISQEDLCTVELAND